LSVKTLVLGQGPEPCMYFGGEDGSSPGNAPSSPSFQFELAALVLVATEATPDSNRKIIMII